MLDNDALEEWVNKFADAEVRRAVSDREIALPTVATLAIVMSHLESAIFAFDNVLAVSGDAPMRDNYTKIRDATVIELVAIRTVLRTIASIDIERHNREE